MNIVCWNIDGWVFQKIWPSLEQLIKTKNPDVICLLETKSSDELLQKELAPKLKEFGFDRLIVNAHCPSNFHGLCVALKSGLNFNLVNPSVSCAPRSDNKSKTKDGWKGRLILLENKKLDMRIVFTYVPNSGRPEKSGSKMKHIDYRLQQWNPSLEALLKLHNDSRTIWAGDLNVISDSTKDCSHFKKMSKYAGATKEEMEAFNQFLSQEKWCDIWRKQNPTSTQYTWRGQKKAKDYGLRLDAFIVSPNVVNLIQNSWIDIECSADTDHVPIGIEISIQKIGD
jgi:exodeoxyribonuclease-3